MNSICPFCKIPSLRYIVGNSYVHLEFDSKTNASIDIKDCGTKRLPQIANLDFWQHEFCKKLARLSSQVHRHAFAATACVTAVICSNWQLAFLLHSSQKSVQPKIAGKKSLQHLCIVHSCLASLCMQADSHATVANIQERTNVCQFKLWPKNRIWRNLL